MKVRVKVAVPNDIPRHLMAIACAPDRLDSVSRLRADGNCINARRASILRYCVPFIQVEVEDVRLFYSCMQQSDADWVSNVSFEDGSNWISKHPGAVVLLLI
jgi:hypothetical protein